MDIFCKVTAHGLVPLYDSDYDLKKRLRVGSVVKCKVSNPRNYEHHKKFFALVRLTFDNLPSNLAEYLKVHNDEDMLRRFKRDLGKPQRTRRKGDRIPKHIILGNGTTRV